MHKMVIFSLVLLVLGHDKFEWVTDEELQRYKIILE